MKKTISIVAFSLLFITSNVYAPKEYKNSTLRGGAKDPFSDILERHKELYKSEKIAEKIAALQAEITQSKPPVNRALKFDENESEKSQKKIEEKKTQLKELQDQLAPYLKSKKERQKKLKLYIEGKKTSLA